MRLNEVERKKTMLKNLAKSIFVEWRQAKFPQQAQDLKLTGFDPATGKVQFRQRTPDGEIIHEVGVDFMLADIAVIEAVAR
jgi:hypothetical protein